jgi:hypothetical protein
MGYADRYADAETRSPRHPPALVAVGHSPEGAASRALMPLERGSFHCQAGHAHLITCALGRVGRASWAGCAAIGGVSFFRGRVAWIGGVVLAVAVITVVLLVITAKKDDDFWRLAVPTYLTGVGTLALAVLNVMLLRQEAADREALADAQTQRDRDDALREARKVISLQPPPGPRGLVGVLNASTEPIVDVRLIWAGSEDDTPPGQVWTWSRGEIDPYREVLLAGDRLAFEGGWLPIEPANRTSMLSGPRRAT